MDSTRSDALSIKTPLGSPFESLSIFPPIGSGVFLVIPASLSARLFTIMAWPSALSRAMGLSVEIASNSSMVGNRASGHFFSIHPLPITQEPSDTVFA